MVSPPSNPRPPIIIKIWHPEPPKPKQSIRIGRGGKRVFPDPSVVAAERSLRRVARSQVKRLRLECPYLGPVEMQILFLIGMDGTHIEQKTNKKPVDALERPDVDNLCKLVKDALKGPLGLFLDDSQVISLKAKKVLSIIQGTYIRLLLSDPRNPHQWKLRIGAAKRATELTSDEKMLLKEEEQHLTNV